MIRGQVFSGLKVFFSKFVNRVDVGKPGNLVFNFDAFSFHSEIIRIVRSSVIRNTFAMKKLSRTPRTEFSESLSKDLETKIDQALKAGAEPIAAFDADGTLWDMDVGEYFFDYQINRCHLPHLRDVKDPWRHYLDLKKDDHRKAYAWLIQINQGQTEKKVREWALAGAKSLRPVPIFPSMQRLVQFLRSRQVEIYVVTASIKYAVEPVANLAYGLAFDHTLGVTTEVESGLVTDIVCHPLTWREGKAEALLKATSGRRPLLCAGNTDGDIALIAAASHIQLAVATQDIENSLRKAEQALQTEAERRGWTKHLFRS